jgi:hypothetical protein
MQSFADIINGSLRIQVIGESSKVILWVAFVTRVQVVEFNISNKFSTFKDQICKIPI